MDQATEKLSAFALAERLVQREVAYCVSSMVSDVASLLAGANIQDCAHQIEPTYEELVDLQVSQPNYQEAAEDADWELLPDMGYVFVQTHPGGSFEDACTARGWELSNVAENMSDEHADHEYAFARLVPDGEPLHERIMANDEDDAWEALAKTLGLPEQCKFESDADDDAEAWQELCEYEGIDADSYRSEAYEHWIVSWWLARKLAEHGEITGQLWGLHIWGRCCTGQSMTLDHVIQQIAIELWPDEYNGKEMPYDKD